jgi:hypothetical protein
MTVNTSGIGRNIIDVLELFGEIDWYRYRPIINKNQDLKNPHLSVWRYKEKKPAIEDAIVNAVNSFQGEVEWVIEFSGRNWSIIPKVVNKFIQEHNEFRTDSEAMAAFADKSPEVGEMANKDLPDLAEHIKKFVQQGLSSKISA